MQGQLPDDLVSHQTLEEAFEPLAKQPLAASLVRDAHELMRERGLEPVIPDPAEREVRSLPALPDTHGQQISDLRHLLWSSIDNPESRDLDQVEYAERLDDGDIRLLIGISNVAARVARDSAIDRHARTNTVTVYTGVAVFPMLPERLSTDLTSLNQAEDRLAVVIELHISPSGNVLRSNVFRAWLHNHSKLDYETVGAWLERDGGRVGELSRDTALEQQVRWQAEAAQRMEQRRSRAGALNFESVEARPVVRDGRVVDIALVQANRARELIENLMVAANIAMAAFLVEHNVPAIRRVVRTPKRWDRIVEIAAGLGDRLPAQPDSRALSEFLARRQQADPAGYLELSLTVMKLLGSGEYALDRPGDQDSEGHFGLAVAEYTHSTAPNRRYPDLIIQRLARAVLAGEPVPYSEQELDAIARHCTMQEDAARKVERTMRKKAAAVLLSDRIGQQFPAIVTGASDKGTYVRLLRPPVEGRVVRGMEGLDVGERTRVRLLSVNVARGHIDFARVSE